MGLGYSEGLRGQVGNDVPDKVWHSGPAGSVDSLRSFPRALPGALQPIAEHGGDTGAVHFWRL